MLNLIVAEALPSPAAEELYTWLKCVVCAAGIYYLFLKIVQAHRRQPPVEESLRKIDEQVMQRFEAIKVTVMPREEIESEVQRLDKYVHDMRHEVREELQGITAKIDENGAEVRETMAALRTELENRRSTGVANLHSQLKGAEVQLAAVKKEAEVHTVQINQLDQKLERMPERILALLTNRHKS